MCSLPSTPITATLFSPRFFKNLLSLLFLDGLERFVSKSVELAETDEYEVEIVETGVRLNFDMLDVFVDSLILSNL